MSLRGARCSVFAIVCAPIIQVIYSVNGVEHPVVKKPASLVNAKTSNISTLPRGRMTGRIKYVSDPI
jgi:hypothetical protein